MQHVLKAYPNNKIVWAHMGLSKELTKMNSKLHVAIMRKALDTYPNLMLDISWDVIYNAYYQYGQDFIDLFNAYPTRILNGSDFVASADKPFEQYWKELEVTSRVNRRLNDEAYQHKMADAILSGMKKYFSKNPPLAKSKLARLD